MKIIKASMPTERKKRKTLKDTAQSLTGKVKFADEMYIGSEPDWDDIPETESQLKLKLSLCFNYYNYFYTHKDFKPVIISWCKNSGEFTSQEISQLKSIDEWRFPVTYGSLIKMLHNGMPEELYGRNYKDFLLDNIKRIKEQYSIDVQVSEDDTITTEELKISVHDRIKEKAELHCSKIEDWLESFYTDKTKFNPKGFDIVSYLRLQQANPSIARYIKKFYTSTFEELKTLFHKKSDTDEYRDLAESYNGYSAKEVKKLYEAYLEIDTACELLMQEQKVRKPKAKKEVSKDKLVEKLKYCKTDSALKLVSINPIDIIGAKELWVFNIKTRKLGKYVAINKLEIKKSTIVGFDEDKSIQKTLRKPSETLLKFKDSGKVALRKFLDEINTVEIKLTGKITEEIILLRVTKGD